jgi:hypothetical protein
VTFEPKLSWLKAGAMALGWCCLGLVTLWAVAALGFDLPVPWLRGPLAAGYLLAILAVWIRARRTWKALATVAGFLVVLLWWLTLRPSNDRDWQPDLARLSYADLSSPDRVTIHNIRNCELRTETDYDVHYYDKTFELDKLRTVDLYLVYWGSPHIAHTMVSFGFEGGDYVCISIETRKEKGESYSAVRGFFRQYELIYVIADERDVVRVRTNYRHGDDVYLYRARMTPEQGRTFFLEYLRRANELRERPEWYNALDDNCTTSIRAQRAADERAPWNWRLLANGHLDWLLYQRDNIVGGLPFAELKQRSLINKQARAADQAPDFSRLIRLDVPGTAGQNP